MAVEKSYARLGLFLVIAIVVVLATALLFIQRMRSREVIELVTYTQENVSRSRHLEPGALPRRRRGAGVEPAGGAGRPHDRDRLRAVHRSPHHRRRQCHQPPGTGRGRGVFLERLRAQVVGNPVTGEAYLFLDMPENPPPPMTLGFTPESAVHPVDADADCGAAGPVARSAGARRGDAPGPSGDRRPDARQPRPGRPVLHQRRTHRPRERAAGTQRRLAEVLLDDKRADRGRSPRTWTDWSATRARCRSSPTRHAPPSTRQTCPPPAAPRARPWTRPAWRRRTCGARCPRYASRSGSCASSRGSCRNSRSRWSTAHGRRERRNDACDRLRTVVVLVVLACLAGVACQLKRPETIPVRMIEPQLLAPQPPERAAQGTSGANAASVRLLDTQARGHIGRRLLHQQPMVS